MAETFADLMAPKPLLEALAARGYESPMPVQHAVLAPEALGKDLLVSSRTGSGKTVAFGLAMAGAILEEGKPSPGQPLGLVVAPTRELAQQVAAELQWLYGKAGARVATCVGGTDVSREVRALREGPHLVAGTPGRLVDHLERKTLKLEGLRVLVLDEADEMLDMGFREELERILRDAPEARRTLLFSATIPTAIEQLARKFQKDALRLTVTPKAQAHQDIEVRAHLIATREREHAVVNTLRFSDAPSAIVFCATRDAVNHLSASLLERGFAAVALSGELTQSERTRALKALRDGRARVLVATDVAARGLDLPDVGLVIQADLPANAEVLQHRNGRTGRAGRKGVAVLLVPSSSRRGADALLRRAGVRASWSPVPAPDVIRVRDRDRLARDIEALVREPAEDDLALARLLLRERSAEELAAALVKVRRESLPAPEELPLSSDAVAHQERKGFGFGSTGPSRTERRAHAAPERAAGHSERSLPARAGHSERSVPAHAEHAERSAPARAAHSERSAPARAGHSERSASARAPHSTPARAAYAERSTSAHAGRPARPADSRPHEPRAASGKPALGNVWFRVNVGRSKNADPRWLLPLLCRRGGVVKNDIGKIEILSDHSKFEVSSRAARRFQEAAAKPDKKDPAVSITPIR